MSRVHETGGTAVVYCACGGASWAHDYLLFFTNTGRVFLERVYEIPEMSRTATGRSIANLLNFRENEKVAALIRLEATYDDDRNDITLQQPGYLFFATSSGKVKKSLLSDYANIRKDGIKAIEINEGDSLIQVLHSSGDNSIVLITSNGLSIRFNEKDVRSMGRVAAGVKGITLRPDDRVVAVSKVDLESTLLVASEKGIGKRSVFEEYRVQSRGGKGIITMKTGDKTGKVVGALTVHDDDEIMLISSSGLMVRTKVDAIRVSGRATTGVKLLNIGDESILVSIAPVIEDEDESSELNSGDESTESEETSPDSEEVNEVEPGETEG